MIRRSIQALMAALVALSAVTVPAVPAHAASWTSIFLESQSAGTCVAVPDFADGSAATQEICTDVNLQLWNVTEIVTGTYRISNFGSGKCLTAVGTSTGSPVQQLTCNGASTQRWSGNGSGNALRFTNAATGKCLSRPGKDPGTALIQGSCAVPYALWSLLF
ncbi:RICIN domain-containing protein [Catellatospora methionotrophica]|uniref:RICIN domain-containing protein n=1 Tax=Catellatospora methionotrophica TaxID=121620 RepID=UPI0033F13939